jgi:hypothetical protein
MHRSVSASKVPTLEILCCHAEGGDTLTAFASAAAQAFATGGATADAWARAFAAAIAQYGCDAIRPILARTHFSSRPMI